MVKLNIIFLVMIKYLFYLALFSVLAYPYKSDTLSTKIVKAFRIDSEQLIFDGSVTDNIWNGTGVGGFIQRDPEEGKPATEPTYIWVAYDDHYLYIAARMADSVPESIDRSLGRRDAGLPTDWINIFLDPYYDRKTGYYFSVNPAGVTRDGVFFNDGWDDDTWDGIWEVKTIIDDKGWSAEFKIPFSQLRFNESEAMVWGVNFSRNLNRIKEDSYFVMVPKKESGFVSRFARLEGLENVKAKQRFEVMPYFVQKAQYLIHDPLDPFYKSKQYDNSFGADFKFGLGSNFNVDATINPDFGQVEVDPAVMNLSAFESYFQEKRPFFIEGANIFLFGMEGSNNNWGFNFGTPEFFYSRRIGRAPRGSISDADFADYPGATRILGAAKISGKVSEGTTLGAMTAVTERTYAKLWKNGGVSEEEVEPLTHYGVLRLKKELNDSRQMIGVIFTTVNRDLSDRKLYDNLVKNSVVFGVDGYSFLDEEKNYVITGSVVGSYINGSESALERVQKHPVRYMQRPDVGHLKFDPNRKTLTGIYSRFMLNKQSGNFYVNAALGAVSPGMDYNDLGFQGMADRINGHLVLGYRWYEPFWIIRNASVYTSHSQSFDFGGNNTNKILWFMSQFNFTNYWGMGFRGDYGFESLNRSATRGGPMIIQPSDYSVNGYFYSDSRKEITFETGFFYGSSDDKSVYKGVNLYIGWKPDSRLKFNIGPSYSVSTDARQWVSNVSDPSAINTYGTRYIFGKIEQKSINANIRLDLTFTPRLSLQLFAQPFSAVGKYSEFKELKRPRSQEFLVYGTEGSSINFDGINNEYTLDPDGTGGVSPFRISNPDFNFKSLRGNIVLRWEALPGSIFYLVWSRDQANFDDPGTLNLRRDFKNLIRSEGNDIFLIKFNYWWDL